MSDSNKKRRQIPICGLPPPGGVAIATGGVAVAPGDWAARPLWPRAILPPEQVSNVRIKRRFALITSELLACYLALVIFRSDSFCKRLFVTARCILLHRATEAAGCLMKLSAVSHRFFGGFSTIQTRKYRHANT